MRASRANMTERSYEKIFCSNMMKTNQDIIKDGLTEQTVDIFIENSECPRQVGLGTFSTDIKFEHHVAC